MSSSKPQVALVTGASSGIGKATALALIGAGFTTYATARRPAALADLSAQGCRPLALDVTSEESMVAAVQAVEAEHGAVDLLINNAGYGLNGPVEELALNDVRHEFETNVFGLIRLSQLVLPAMRRQRRGRIVNVGSIGGTFTAPGAGAYHASKYAVEAFSDALRMEVRSFGIDVILIQPTGVHTAFASKIKETMRDTRADSPYATFKRSMDAQMEQMFSGRGYGVISAEEVARVILGAVQASKPHARYKAGFSAHIYTGLRRLLPDRAWDAMMMQMFKIA